MDFDFASQPGKPDMLLGMDVNEDAIVMINAEGQIMMVSQVCMGQIMMVSQVWYPRSESFWQENSIFVCHDL